MSLILRNVIALLPYAYRTRTLFRRGTYTVASNNIGTELPDDLRDPSRSVGKCYTQYTPPTPTRLNCRVELRRPRVGVGGVY